MILHVLIDLVNLILVKTSLFLRSAPIIPPGIFFVNFLYLLWSASKAVLREEPSESPLFPSFCQSIQVLSMFLPDVPELGAMSLLHSFHSLLNLIHSISQFLKVFELKVVLEAALFNLEDIILAPYMVRELIFVG